MEITMGMKVSDMTEMNLNMHLAFGCDGGETSSLHISNKETSSLAAIFYIGIRNNRRRSGLQREEIILKQGKKNLIRGHNQRRS